MKIFILTIFLTKTTFAAYIPKKDKTPPVLGYIITALQTSQLYPVHKNEINSLILQMDHAFSSLDDNDVNLIIESEIFKVLLSFPPSSKHSLHTLSPDMSNDLYTFSKKIRSPFFSWLALAVYMDLKSLFNSPHFPSFKKNIKSSHGKWNNQMTLMKKKISLLLPWYDYLINTQEKQLTENIYSLLLKCLRQIHFKSARYSSLTPLRPPLSR